MLSVEVGSGGRRVGCSSEVSRGNLFGKPWDRRHWSRLRASHFETVPPDGWLINRDPQQAMSHGMEDAGVHGALSQRSGPPCRASSGGGWAVAVPYLCGRVWISGADRRLGSCRDPEHVMGSRTQHWCSSFFVGVQVLARPSSNAHQPWTAPSLQCESSLAVPLPFPFRLCLPPSEASATSDQLPGESQQPSGGTTIVPVAAEEGAETGEHHGACFFPVDGLASLTYIVFRADSAPLSSAHQALGALPKKVIII